MTKVAISSGHGLKIRGAARILDEVNEARRVVDRVHAILSAGGVGTTKFHDNTSTTQGQNLAAVVSFHNKQVRELDVSVHFNAASYTTAARGCEVLHFNAKGKANAVRVSAAMSKAGGLKDRGAKARPELAFLRGTNRPAILLEVCFVDSVHDAARYIANFEALCQAIAEEIAAIVGHTLKTAQKAQEATKDVFYIKTGTFNTKAQAEAAVARMKKLGLVSVAHVMPDGKGKFYVKSGTFQKKYAAENILAKMKKNKIVWVGYVLAA